MSNTFLPSQIVTLYSIWLSIKIRCTKPTHPQFKNYGGRGITLCDRWMDFDAFAQDVGVRPKKNLELDRIDNEKGYFPGNIRWCSRTENARNRRNNRVYQTHLGVLCQSELIENMGYTRKQFNYAVEKHGIDKLLIMFQNNNLPPKRIIPTLHDILGKKFGKLTVISLDPDKKTGPRYFCKCDCGNDTRISRHKLIHKMVVHCKGCSKRGNLNPNSKYKKALRLGGLHQPKNKECKHENLETLSNS